MPKTPRQMGTSFEGWIKLSCMNKMTKYSVWQQSQHLNMHTCGTTQAETANVPSAKHQRDALG